MIAIAPSVSRVDLTVDVVSRSDIPFDGYGAWFDPVEKSISINDYVLHGYTPILWNSVLTHELGHALGLADIGGVNDPENTIYQGSLMYRQANIQNPVQIPGGHDKADYYYKWP